ncbi:MAG: glutamate--tRNA ligase, partial [Sediminimonas sp.]|uniref:glutamate--tRNA ligase n=1 Tax=Sediminimonas sp. TaxID=2823379 RepID=UPI00286FC454
MPDQVVTRFAPSPTGFLHIGGARTALFNWLFARGRGGKFLLRIEDTDRARSTPEATQAILTGLNWLGLDHDGDVVSQAAGAERHAEIAERLLDEGKAYKCFSTSEDIAAFREKARAEGRSTLFRSPWRDADPATYPDAPFAIRIKAPREGETVIRDQVQGDVRIRNDQLDDMVLLRGDGSPVYMLAVVVDDHDMGVTHVIRGDDHLNNAARQMMIYQAMGWDVPVWAHIPLIHGPDGKKLSKRHGALGVE